MFSSSATSFAAFPPGAQNCLAHSTRTLSRLEGSDEASFAESISNLAQQKTYLEAAQQSFMKVSNLSLFNYL